ncbi:hypothetical protein NGB24_07165 [Mammaliicoccus vitulinus]|uniref:hypothetical protein n=1 Tax=Mammaliicoccus vitulinus TaxID=71237 RepID=UPI002DB5E875|nr:hypothetical protein [Mammaliicoccus vitulinus]MEB7657632.1 hypothetical protein [Mammaliicoccus vitulinus]
MKKLIGILVILLLVASGCSQNESEMSEDDFEKIAKDNEKYEKEIKKFAKGIVEVADKHDAHIEDDVTDKETAEFVKRMENKLKNQRKKFEKETEKIFPDDISLGDHLVKASKMYETYYNETSRLYKINDDKEEYDAPTTFAEYTLSNNYDMAAYEMQYEYDDIGKDERDMLLGEELSNELDETLVVTDGELEESYSEIGEMSQYDQKITIPENEYEKFYTDDASWKLFELSGILDEEKDETQSEYNELVENYNTSVHPIMQTKTIDEPTTSTISNHLIVKGNAIVDAKDTMEE